MPRKPVPGTPPRIDADVRAEIDITAPLKLSEQCMEDLTSFIERGMTLVHAQHSARMEKVERWRKTLSGVNPDAPLRTGVSNVSVPLTMWASNVAQANLEQSVLPTPLLNIQPVGNPKRGEDDFTLPTKNLAKFLEAMLRNKRALDGESVISQVSQDQTDWGLGAWKVAYTQDSVRNVGVTESNETIQAIERGTARWYFISFDDLIFWNGYGTCVNEMPFVGHTVRNRTWGSILQWVALNHYYKNAAMDIERFFADEDRDLPALHRQHDIDELYLDWDVNEDNILESIVVDWHKKANKILRVAWNPFGARRPIVMVQYARSPRQTDGQGQGVCEVLQSPQEEANSIHNIGIEGGKRGIAHLVVVKQDRAIAGEIGGDEGVLPGTVVATEDPDEDVEIYPLGDPQAAAQAIALEELNRVYAARLLGLDETAVGNVAAGKRVPAAIGVPAMKAGQSVGRRAINSLADGMQEGVYLTIELYRKRMPTEALRAMFSDEEILLLSNYIFNLNADTARTQVVIKVLAQDANIAAEKRKTEQFTMVQFLMTFYERMVGSMQMVLKPQLPQGARDIFLKITEKLLASAESMLNSLESVHDPAEFLLDIAELKESMSQISQSVQTAAGQPQALPAGQEDESGF